MLHSLDESFKFSALSISFVSLEQFTNCVSLLDALVAMEKAMKRDKIEVNDRQVCPEGLISLKLPI